MKIVVTPPFTEEQKALILSAAERPEDVIFCLKSDMTEELLREADVLLGNLESPGQLEKTEHLKWIQLNNAGTEGYCVPGRLPQGAVLTNATGAYGLAISEHMLACLFMLRKKLNLYYANQLQSQWKSEGHVGVIQGTTVLVIGLGDIGTCFASKMKALGCTTIGVKRRVGEKPDCVDGLYGTGFPSPPRGCGGAQPSRESIHLPYAEPGTDFPPFPQRHCTERGKRNGCGYGCPQRRAVCRENCRDST